MGAHLIDGKFQSDKYPTTPPGKVPLSVEDPTAQDLLWTYAQRRRDKDAEFADDLETALGNEGFVPQRVIDGTDAFDGLARALHAIAGGHLPPGFLEAIHAECPDLETFKTVCKERVTNWMRQTAKAALDAYNRGTQS